MGRTQSGYALAGTILALAACNNVVPDASLSLSSGTVKLGLLAPRSGFLTVVGLSMENTARLAINEINDAGGVNGQLIELIVRDTRGSDSLGPSGAQYLIDQGVVGIVGPLRSSVMLATASTTIAANMPLMSPGASSPAITSLVDGGTVFRTVASDAFAGNILADQIYDRGHTTLVIMNINDSYGNGYGDALAARFATRGGTLLRRTTFDGDKTVGFTSEVADAFSAGVPAAMAIIAFQVNGASITRDIAAYNPSPVPALFGGDGFQSSEFTANASAAVATGMIIARPASDTTRADNITFVANHTSVVGQSPGPGSEATYDAVYLMALAMAQGGANTSTAILNNLRAVSRADTGSPTLAHVAAFATAAAAAANGDDIDYSGARGAADLDANGDLSTGSYAVFELRDSGGTLSFVQISLETF